MQISASLKLNTTKEQSEALADTMRAFNALCTDIARDNPDATNAYSLHSRVYRHARSVSDLSSQFVIRAIARVAGANKTRKAQESSKKVRKKKGVARSSSFRQFAAVPYDARLLNISSLLLSETISIASLAGRQKVKVCLDERNKGVLLLGKIAGSALLIRSHTLPPGATGREGDFYLSLVVDVPEPESTPAEDVLGVDMGVVNIAVCSDGTVFLSDCVENVRQRYARTRKSLQEKGTRSARRRLKKIGSREQRFRRDPTLRIGQDVNHCISKQIVTRAEGTKSAIALEDLSGINSTSRAYTALPVAGGQAGARATVRKKWCARRFGWSFSQLRFFIEYKAKLRGVDVIVVPPAYTSQTCPACGHADKKNRPSQSAFICRSCGLKGDADYIASLNIRALGIKILGARQCACNVAPSIKTAMDNIKGTPLKGTDVGLNASAPGSYKPAALHSGTRPIGASNHSSDSINRG